MSRPNPTQTYAKPAKSAFALLRHIQAKGLSIKGEQKVALRALQFIGYYRLLIYMRPFQDRATKKFYQGVKFTDVLAVYDFDRKLRLLCLDAVERIEVAIRSAIVTTVASKKGFGPHFFYDERKFESPQAHRDFMKSVVYGSAGKTLPVDHYYRIYCSPSSPPIWALLEGVTFGNISFLYAGLHLSVRKEVASLLGYDETVLVSWFKSINVLRNFCAHHNRIWNFDMLVNAPVFANRIRPEFPIGNRAGSFFARAVILQALLKEIDPTSDWSTKFKALIQAFPAVQLTKAGLNLEAIGITDPNWDTRAFWS